MFLTLPQGSGAEHYRANHQRQSFEALNASALLQAVAWRAQAGMDSFAPQNISNLLWSFATLRHHPGTALLHAAAHAALQLMPCMNPQVR